MKHQEITTLLDKAEEHLKQSDYPQAEKLANEVLALGPERKEDEAFARCILGRCCRETVRYDDAISHFSLAIDIAEEISNLRLQARALSGKAKVHRLRDEHIASLHTAEQALIVAEKSDDKLQQAEALFSIGNAHTFLADYPRALDYLGRTLVLSEEAGNKIGIAGALSDIGKVHLQLGDNARALDYFVRALGLAEEMVYKPFTANILENIGNVFDVLADYAQALDYKFHALALYEKLGNKYGVAISLTNIGNIYFHFGDHQRALDYRNRALVLAEKIGHKEIVAVILGNIGLIYKDSGDFPQALEYLKRAIELSELIGDHRAVGYWMNGFANANLKLGNLDIAFQDYLNTLYHRREVLLSNVDVAETLLGLGRVLLGQGKREEGLARLEEALTLAKELGEKKTAAETHKEIANAYAKAGDLASAYEHSQKHYELKEEIFSEKSRQLIDSFNIRAAIANQERDTELHRLRAEKAETTIRLKERELANTASSLAAQTELLGDFRTDLRKIVMRPDKYEPEDIIRQVKAKLKELPCEMIDFGKFEAQFATVHPEFRAGLETKFPDLTPQEVKVCMLLHVNLKSAAIGRLICVSERGVENHRFNIRKKLALKTEDSLTKFLQEL